MSEHRLCPFEPVKVFKYTEGTHRADLKNLVTPVNVHYAGVEIVQKSQSVMISSVICLLFKGCIGNTSSEDEVFGVELRIRQDVNYRAKVLTGFKKKIKKERIGYTRPLTESA